MKNLEGLQKYSKHRNEVTFEKVNKVIAGFKKSKKKITITEVARKAGVSIATIYNNPVLREHIIQIKEMNKIELDYSNVEPIKCYKSSQNIRIDELHMKNQEQRKEIENLKIEKGLILGQLRDLATENLELKTTLENYRNLNIKKL